MNLTRKSLYTTLVVICLILLGGVQSSFAWTGFVSTNQLYGVGQQGSEWSYLYEINPLTGDLRLIGDTGLNNCTGLDFTPEGKLKAFCELREGGEFDNRNGAQANPAVAAELDIDDGAGEWAVIHGVTSAISDISINEQGELFSYENIETEVLHKHLEESDFMANQVGETGVEAQDHALAFWGDGELKMAANTGSPSLYIIDTESGVATKTADLLFPSLEVLSVSTTQTRIIEPADIHFNSMDSVSFSTLVISAFDTRAFDYPFIERESDAVVLMSPEGNGPNTAVSRRLISGPVVGLLDVDTNQVDYLVELPGEVQVRAIAVRPLPVRPIPTMSEWAFIMLASALGIIGFIVMRKRKAVC